MNDNAWPEVGDLVQFVYTDWRTGEAHTRYGRIVRHLLPSDKFAVRTMKLSKDGYTEQKLRKKEITVIDRGLAPLLIGEEP